MANSKPHTPRFVIYRSNHEEEGRHSILDNSIQWAKSVGGYFFDLQEESWHNGLGEKLDDRPQKQ